jgi:hypothetical protein
MVTKDKPVCELNLPHVRFSDSLPHATGGKGLKTAKSARGSPETRRHVCVPLAGRRRAFSRALLSRRETSLIHYINNNLNH